MRQLFKDLSRLKDVVCEENRPLAPLTTMKVGGAARLFVRPLTLSGLEGLLGCLNRWQVPYKVLGNGSNLIIDDKGIGVVVSLCGLRRIRFNHKDTLYAEAGCSISGLIGLCMKKGLNGLEPLVGIPGSLGGALFMNAGANGVSIGDFVEEICVTTGQGSSWFKVSDDFFSYRSSKTPKGALISAAKLRIGDDYLEGSESSSPYQKSLVWASPGVVHENLKKIMKKRLSSQPLGRPSAGCVFKNPSKHCSAWSLIASCGLQGQKVNDAQVSTKHANFIVNLGDATASDIMELMGLIKKRVWEETGVILKEEVVVWRHETEH